MHPSLLHNVKSLFAPQCLCSSSAFSKGVPWRRRAITGRLPHNKTFCFFCRLWHLMSFVFPRSPRKLPCLEWLMTGHFNQSGEVFDKYYQCAHLKYAKTNNNAIDYWMWDVSRRCRNILRAIFRHKTLQSTSNTNVMFVKKNHVWLKFSKGRVQKFKYRWSLKAFTCHIKSRKVFVSVTDTAMYAYVIKFCRAIFRSKKQTLQFSFMTCSNLDASKTFLLFLLEH